MEFEQLVKLIEVMDASGLSEFDYETEGVKLHLGRKIENVVHMTPMMEQAVPVMNMQSQMKEAVPMETEAYKPAKKEQTLYPQSLGCFMQHPVRKRIPL